MRFLLLSLSLVLTLFTLGCRGGSVATCDTDSDCVPPYSCDGVFCSCVVGEAGAECAGDGDCSGDQICTDCACVARPGACTSVTETKLANELDSEAQDLGTLDADDSFCITGSCDPAVPGGDVDFYRVEVPDDVAAAPQIGAQVTDCEEATALTTIEVLDGNGNFIDGVIDGQCDVWTVASIGGAGPYFVVPRCDAGAAGSFEWRLSREGFQ